MTEASETLIATLIHMAECKDMGRGPAPDCPLRKAAAEITRLQAEVDRLREALEEIADPISAMQTHAEVQGVGLDGMMANILAKDPEYLKAIARAALTAILPDLREQHYADEIERLRAALEWYAVRVADCRKASSEGVEACRQLDADGGSRARQALGTDKEDRTDG